MEIVGDEPLKASPGFLDQPFTLTKPGEVTIQTTADNASFHVYVKTGFLTRVWFLLTNPFYYLFTGYWRL